MFAEVACMETKIARMFAEVAHIYIGFLLEKYGGRTSKCESHTSNSGNRTRNVESRNEF